MKIFRLNFSTEFVITMLFVFLIGCICTVPSLLLNQDQEKETVIVKAITPCQADIFTVGLERKVDESKEDFAMRARETFDCLQVHYTIIHSEPIIDIRNGVPDVVAFVVFYLPKDKKSKMEKETGFIVTISQELFDVLKPGPEVGNNPIGEVIWTYVGEGKWNYIWRIYNSDMIESGEKYLIINKEFIEWMKQLVNTVVMYRKGK